MEGRVATGPYPDRPRRNSQVPGPGGRRLLKLLDRPMRATEIVKQLGVTHQRVRQLVIKLHAQGYVTFGDAEGNVPIDVELGEQALPALSR